MSNPTYADDYANIDIENYEETETETTETCDPCDGCEAKGSYCRTCPYKYGNN